MSQFWASRSCLINLGVPKEGAYSFSFNESDLQNKHSELPKSIINIKSKIKICVTEFDSAALKKKERGKKKPSQKTHPLFLCCTKVKELMFQCFIFSKYKRSCFQLTLYSWRNVLGRKMFKEIVHFKQILWNIYKKLILSSQSCICPET